MFAKAPLHRFTQATYQLDVRFLEWTQEVESNHMNLMKNVTIWGAAAVLAIGGFSVVAQAQGPGGGRGPGGPHGGPGALMGMLGTAIGLTDAQKAEIKTIFETARTSNASLHEELKASREAEKAAIKAGKSDAELAQLAASYSQLHVRMHTTRLQTEAKVYKVLTPEQRAKVEKLKEEMQSRMAGRFGGRSHHAPVE